MVSQNIGKPLNKTHQPLAARRPIPGRRKKRVKQVWAWPSLLYYHPTVRSCTRAMTAINPLGSEPTGTAAISRVNAGSVEPPCFDNDADEALSDGSPRGQTKRISAAGKK